MEVSGPCICEGFGQLCLWTSRVPGMPPHTNLRLADRTASQIQKAAEETSSRRKPPWPNPQFTTEGLYKVQGLGSDLQTGND